MPHQAFNIKSAISLPSCDFQVHAISLTLSYECHRRVYESVQRVCFADIYRVPQAALASSFLTQREEKKTHIYMTRGLHEPPAHIPTSQTRVIGIYQPNGVVTRRVHAGGGLYTIHYIPADNRITRAVHLQVPSKGNL